MGSNGMKIKFVGKKHESNNIYTFRFEKPSGFRQIAGQFIELSLPHNPYDDRGQKRWFTLSNSPTEKYLSISTRIFEDKKSSFKKYLENLKSGQEVNMTDPMGDFVLPKDESVALIFVASGVGCTPFRSIIKNLLDAGQQRNITLIHSVATKDDLVFSEIFKYLGQKYITLIGKNKLSAQSLNELWRENINSYIYLSGPEPLVEALKKDLIKSKVSSQNIYIDSFPGYMN